MIGGSADYFFFLFKAFFELALKKKKEEESNKKFEISFVKRVKDRNKTKLPD